MHSPREEWASDRYQNEKTPSSISGIWYTWEQASSSPYADSKTMTAVAVASVSLYKKAVCAVGGLGGARLCDSGSRWAGASPPVYENRITPHAVRCPRMKRSMGRNPCILVKCGNPLSAHFQAL